MGAELLTKIEKRIVYDLVKGRNKPVGILNAWICGGSLNRANSKDIDVLVMMDHVVDFEECQELNTQYLEVGSIHRQYDDDDSAKDYIVKLVPREGVYSRPVDVMLTSSRYFDPVEDTIGSYMGRIFPLSIQRIAVNVLTGELTDNSDANEKSIIVAPWVNLKGDYVQKYLDYYPDKDFYQLVKIERAEQEAPFDDIPF